MFKVTSVGTTLTELSEVSPFRATGSSDSDLSSRIEALCLLLSTSLKNDGISNFQFKVSSEKNGNDF
jgi:hypothetical protein